MPTVFRPIVEERVPASPPHPANTEYRVAIGTEDWGKGGQPIVEKVQMVYDNEISGRRAPSYPVGTDDELRVRAAMDRVRVRYRAQIQAQLSQLGGAAGGGVDVR